MLIKIFEFQFLLYSQYNRIKLNRNKNNEYNHNQQLLLIIFNLKNFKQIQSTYYYPNWINQKNWTISSIQIPNISIHINDYYIIRKRSNGFQIQNVVTYDLLNIIPYPTNFMIDFDIIHDRKLYILTNRNVQVYDIKTIIGSRISKCLTLIPNARIALTQNQIICYFKVISSLNQQLKDTQLQIIIQFLQTVINVNSFIPFITMLGNVPLFLVFNLVFYLFSIYLASHTKSFKLNRIIHSSYLIFFHIGFIILTILNIQNTQQQLYENVSFLMLIILLIGAIHQVLTLIFGIIYDIFYKIVSIYNINKSFLINSQQKKLKKFNINYKNTETKIKNRNVLKVTQKQSIRIFKNMFIKHQLKQKNILPNQNIYQKFEKFQIKGKTCIQKKIKKQTQFKSNIIKLLVVNFNKNNQKNKQMTFYLDKLNIVINN